MVSDYKKRAVMSRRAEESPEYAGDERRKDPHIGREEFSNYVNCTTSYRMANNDRLDGIDQKISTLGDKFDGLHTALFAQDSNNEHGQPGLMHTARRIENHIDAVCNIAKWVRNGIIAMATTLAAVGGAGKAFGLW